jgi:Ca2+-binding EF-hand superfamily protein
MKMTATVAAIAMTLSSAATHAASRVEKFDTNQDGKVSYNELVAHCKTVNKQLFKIADDNSDGVLSEREMREARQYLLKGCKKSK